jgi:cytochrome c5
MNKFSILAPLCIMATLLPLAAQNGQTTPPRHNPQPSPTSSLQSGYSSEGERAFERNCSRCHDAPQSFSPHVSATVVKHMRVRASLSERDAQSILKFLNP